MDAFSDIDSVNLSLSDDSDASSMSISSEKSISRTSSLSSTPEIHSYSEKDFFGEAGCIPFLTSNYTDTLAAEAVSDADVSDFEVDPQSDCGIDFADKFAEILSKFDDILRDIGIEDAIDLSNERNIIKPCGKVHPLIQGVDRNSDTDALEFAMIQKCGSIISDEDDVLVELLRHAWFVLLLYILVKMYFITI